MTSAADIFKLQQATADAERALWAAIDSANSPESGSLAGSDGHPREQKALDAARATEQAAQAEIGGRVYRIPDVNLGDLENRVTKINKRAAKLGVPPINFTITDEAWDQVRQEAGGVTYVTPHKYVVVGTNSIKLNGYVFAATIEHGGDEGNIIRTVPGIEADLREYRTVDPWCDHCKTMRRRIDTFLVLHEDGHIKQVGRNCLVDFLGSSATSAAQHAQWLLDFEDALEAAGGGGEGGGERAVSLAEFLAHVALSIRERGWTSRGNAYEYGGIATADSAANNMHACQKARYREPGRGDHYSLPSEDDWTTAHATMDWVREVYGRKPIEERDDFEHNLAAATASDFIVPRRYGIAAYAVQGRRKALEEEVKASARKASDFIGAVKEKVSLVVQLAAIIQIEDRYSYSGGTKPLYKFVDDQGNFINWFSSRDVGIVQGETYNLTGTVKAHEDDPRYGRSTILTRCKCLTIN